MIGADRPPQTVGEALKFGWRWINLQCVMCRRKGRVTFDGRPPDMSLARLIRRAKCEACGSKQAHASLVAISIYEKEIRVEGNEIVKEGMN